MSIPDRTYVTVNGEQIMTEEAWYLDGVFHRTDGPAWRRWQIVNDLPVLTTEAWYFNGMYHRIDGPAYQHWRVVDGRPFQTRELWYSNGVLSRVDGPALREWRIINGQVILGEQWYIRGYEVDPEGLRRRARDIERWWRYQRARRLEGVEEMLWDNGMTVFPGFMGMMRQY